MMLVIVSFWAFPGGSGFPLILRKALGAGPVSAAILNAVVRCSICRLNATFWREHSTCYYTASYPKNVNTVNVNIAVNQWLIHFLERSFHEQLND